MRLYCSPYIAHTWLFVYINFTRWQKWRFYGHTKHACYQNYTMYLKFEMLSKCILYVYKNWILVHCTKLRTHLTYMKCYNVSFSRNTDAIMYVTEADSICLSSSLYYWSWYMHNNLASLFLRKWLCRYSQKLCLCATGY